MTPSKEAKCPECNEWSEIVCENYVAPFVEHDEAGKETVSPVHVWGWWWKDSADCPKCDATVLVESECDFRRIRHEKHA